MSPLFHDNLAGLPRAIVATAGFDPLRDEGKAYAEKLEKAGVPTKHKMYKGLLHVCWQLHGAFYDNKPLVDDVVAEFKEVFA